MEPEEFNPAATTAAGSIFLGRDLSCRSGSPPIIVVTWQVFAHYILGQQDRMLVMALHQRLLLIGDSKPAVFWVLV